LTVVRSLAVFNISRPIENGKEVVPDVQFTGTIISHPEPFKADIKVRSKEAEELIRRVEVEHPWIEGDSEKLESIRSG
jgi:hypothetical protein